MLSVDAVRSIEEVLLIELERLREDASNPSKTRDRLVVELDKLESYLDV